MLPLLSIVALGTPAPPIPDATADGVEVWYEPDGRTVAALGHADDDAGWWFHMPGLASFRFMTTGDVVAIDRRGAAEARIRDAYQRSVLPLVLQARGLEVLHASAVLAHRGVIALCAIKETGKSTIAYALSRRGYDLWADDAVAMQIEDRTVRAFPLPFSIRLRPASAAHFGTEAGAAPRIQPNAAPLAALCVLVRDESVSDGAVVSRLTAGAALTAILTHAYCFSLADQDRKGRMVEQYLAVIARVPVFEARFGAGLDRLPAILDAIERAADVRPVRK